MLARPRVVRGPERRQGPKERRRGPRDRRRGRPDPRPQPVERRLAAVADRRSGRPDRRLGGHRRRDARPEPALAADPELVFWAANVLCWAAVTAVALIWGA
jgi:hypothetical protein